MWLCFLSVFQSFLCQCSCCRCCGAIKHKAEFNNWKYSYIFTVVAAET